jgi:hypothetical protein
MPRRTHQAQRVGIVAAKHRVDRRHTGAGASQPNLERLGTHDRIRIKPPAAVRRHMFGPADHRGLVYGGKFLFGKRCECSWPTAIDEARYIQQRLHRAKPLTIFGMDSRVVLEKNLVSVKQRHGASSWTAGGSALAGVLRQLPAACKRLMPA